MGIKIRTTPSFLRLIVWACPIATLLLIPAAIYVPPPGGLSEPRDAREIFLPNDHITPEGALYRFISFDESNQVHPNYVLSMGNWTTQNGTRTFGWDANGFHFGFHDRSAHWKYRLSPQRMDRTYAASGSGSASGSGTAGEDMWMSAAEIEKLRPLLVAELNRREAGRGARLELMLGDGLHAESLICWQNLVVLLAWLSLPFAFVALLWIAWKTIRGRFAKRV